MSIENEQEYFLVMHDSPFSFSKLQIYTPGNSLSTCHVFISSQSPAEESSLGQLFILSEITSNDKVNEDIIKAIQEEIKISYYNTDDLNVEKAFEKSLESVNQRIADMVGDYDINWLDRLHALAAVVTKDTIHFSYVGTSHAFLIRDEKIIDIISSTGETEQNASKINPLKAFSNIISGELQTDDALLFCTSKLLDYFSMEKMKKIIVEQNPTQATATFERLLGANVNNATFGAVVIKFSQATQVQPAEFQATAAASGYATGLSPEESMDELFEKQDRTGDILAPSLSKYFKERLSTVMGKISDFIRINILRQSPRRIKLSKHSSGYGPTSHATGPSISTRPSGPGLNKIKSVLKTTGQLLAGGIRSIALVFSKVGKTEVTGTTGSKGILPRLESTIRKFKSLPKVSKLLIGLALITAFILTQGIYSTAFSRNQQEQNVAIDITVSQISQNILKAEAALSYGNEENAKDLLNEAQILINNLPDKEKENSSKIQELQSNINTQLEKTKHIIITAAPKLIADFSSNDSSARAAEIILVGGTLFTFDPASKTIYAASVDNGGITTWAKPDHSTTWQHIIQQNNQTLLLLNSQNGLEEFNFASGEISPLNFSLPEDVNIIDFSLYDGRLYLTDIKNNQIYRSIKSGNSYSTPVAWIKDDTSTSTTKSMAIDGFIYILGSDGAVTRLFQGSRQAWSLATIDPPLERANLIWTEQDAENIYVMDAAGKRIIEYTKEGVFLNQYTSPIFDKMKDFAIDTANNKIFVLNGTKVFSLDLQ
ncbi:hypothetical protein IID19_04375 [Patescibacteria group bacterium]|nr:hypothetical protein [Patescibacteria group bacterium]